MTFWKSQIGIANGVSKTHEYAVAHSSLIVLLTKHPSFTTPLRPSVIVIVSVAHSSLIVPKHIYTSAPLSAQQSTFIERIRCTI